MKKLLCFVFIANCLLPTADCFSQTWVQKANLPGTARLTAVAFPIGNKGYLGTGSVGFGSSVPDFWEYNPATNAWTQKANFGGGPRGFACGFSIGTKGYIGTGLNNTTYYNDFWEYDPATNIWTQKANCPDSTRWCAVAFAVNGKGYIGLGNHTIGSWYYPQQDLKEYDPVSNTWTQKANYIGLRCDVDRAAFVIGNEAYVGTGGDVTANRNYNDFWQYSPSTNTWTQKANFAGAKRYGATGFSIFGKGYLGLGEDSLYNYYNDFYEYDPIANSWSATTAFPTARCDAPSFVIGCKAYVGTGATNSLYKDLWEFSPAGVGTLSVTATNTVICSGSSITLSASGGSTYTWNNGSTTPSIVVTPVSSATFTVTDSSACVITGSIVINVVPQPTVTVSGNNSICLGSSATLIAFGGTNYSWNTGATTSSIIVSPTSSATTYSEISTAGLCADTNSITVNVSPPPVATVICVDTICAGQSVILSAGGGGNYSWSTGATTSSIPISPSASTTYSVFVSVGACKDTANCSVFVKSAPVAAAFNNVTINAGNSTTLGASGGINYSWSNGASGAVITVSPSVTTNYCVTVLNSIGCTDTACVMVFVNPPEPMDCSASATGEFFLPNAFSPNGDGENDVLKLYFKTPACIKTYQLTIYNRWGEKIFESTDPLAEWDGSYHGSIESSAVFVYYMKAVLISGDEVVKKGNISLIK